MKKEIIIKMPKDAEDIQVYKELSLDNGDSILIKVRENTFGEDATEEQSPDFVIVSPKSLRQRVLLFSDVLPSALFGCKSPCSEVA